MVWYQLFQDGPEYEARRKRSSFKPPTLALKDIHDAVPKHLYKKSTLNGIYYVARHLALTYAFYEFAARIEALAYLTEHSYGLGPACQGFMRTTLWPAYWVWQGMAFAGLWCLGHEAGHGNLSSYSFVNDSIGLALHSFLLVPYFAWRSTHRTHHQSTNHMDRDETYIPFTRKSFKLPDGKVAVQMDYREILEETPAYTLFKLVMRQFLGYPFYLMINRKGNPKYPPGTSHFKPSSLLFKPEQRRSIIASNTAVGIMLIVLGIYIHKTSWSSAWRYYILPWLFANNWIVMFTYLQHSDPTIPYYRNSQWTFARGALCTIDRPFFGWVDRFFFHNMCHDHVAHHFFPTIPFYNQPKVTEAIKPVLGEYYNYDSTPVFYALWRSFTQCTFVEDEGDIVFFKNQRGEAVREPDIPPTSRAGSNSSTIKGVSR